MKLKDIIGSMASKFAAFALALVCAGSVWGAATHQVETQAELTDAIANASAGDTVQITMAGTYTLGNIPQNITIEGAVEGVLFNYPQGAASDFGLIANGCTFDSVSFKFTSQNHHGWWNAPVSAKVTFNSCKFEGLFCNYQDMVFNNCYFKQTEGEYCMWVYTPGTTVEYYGCTFENTVKGKFILVYREGTGSSTAIVKGCTFINNGSTSKPPISVKFTSTDANNVTTALKSTVIVDTGSCTRTGNFPDATANWDDSTGEVVLDDFILLDDRKASYASEIAVVEGSGIVTENGKIASADTLKIAYNDTAVNVESVKSDIVASGSTITENSNGTYTVAVDPYAAYVKVADGFYQNGTTYTASKDFYITNLNGLKYFRDLVNAEKTVSTNYVSRFVSVGNETADAVRSWHTGKMFANKTVHLMADIDLNNEQWTPIGYSTAIVKIDGVDVSVPYFVGVFDGGIYDTNNELTGVHKISNMRVIAEPSTEKAYYAGLFGYCSYSSGNVGIKNLAIENAYVHSASSYVGAFVASFGSGNGNHIIENCHLTGTIDIDGNYRYVGGIVGYARGKIKNCYIEGTGTISSYHGVGGITGYCGTSGSEVSGCRVSGVAVSGDLDYNVGGIAGFAENIVISNNLITAAMVNASSSGYGRVGGVVGFSSAPRATYLVVVDNVIENTTVEVNGTSIPTKIGLSQDNAIVGTGVTFDDSGKVTGGIFENIPASAIASGYVTADNPNTETNVSYPLTIGGPYVAVIYDSDTGKFKKGFKTLADALSDAADGETITLISGPDKAISAKGEVTGGKTVTITGTAKFDWDPGWLFVGRGANAGDGTLIFKDATITRSSDQASYGLHISGKNKSSPTTNYGTLIITNSTIECDVLMNKGSITVYGKDPSVNVPDFEVFNGWGVGGRPANESVSGEHETATFTATDGAYIRLANHNGQGNGYEGNAVMSILNGSKFEYTGESFANGDNCTDGATGVINVDATSLLKMKAFQNLDNGNSFVFIDATGAAGSSKVIDLSGTKSLEGHVTVKNLVAPMTAIYDADGDVTLMSVAAIVNDSSDALVGRYETLAEAVEAYQNGYTIVVVDKTQAIPEGWMFKESGNVTTLVKAVAQIGETKYTSLAAAVEAVPENGAEATTIKMIADVELDATVTIPANKNVVLDLNGKTISADGFANKVNVIVNNGMLTVQNGTIEVSKAVKKTYAIQSNAGELTVKSVVITSNSGGIRVAGGMGTIEDCTITVNTTANTTAHGVYASDGANVTIKSGTYSYTGPIDQDTVQACDDGTVLTIEGGTFTAALDSASTVDATPKVLHSNKSNDTGAGVVYVTGGSFTGDLGANASDMFISGGTFNIATAYTEKIKISGGYFSFEVTPSMCAADYRPAAEQVEIGGKMYYTVETLGVAKIGSNYYASLAAAIAAAQEGDTVEILAAEISEGSITFPATMKNVTIKAADGVTPTLKNMVLNSNTGSTLDYEGITIDGLVFDNSRLLFPGSRTSVVYKDWAIVNCTFKDITAPKGNAAVNFGTLKPGETMNGFTFTNNVIDGVSGPANDNSGLLVNRLSGNVLIEGNLITNVVWNALHLMNGVEGATLMITNNLLSSKATEGVINLYGNKAQIAIAENAIIGDGEGVANIAYPSTTIDASSNYWGGGEPTLSDAQTGGNLLWHSYYTTYADTTDWFTLSNPIVAVAVVKTGDTLKGTYTTLAEALKAANSGDTIEILDGTWGADAIAYDSLTLNEKLAIRTKSLTVQAAEGATPKFVADVFLGYDDSKTVNASMTVRGLAFENAQLTIGEYVQVTVENCSFTGSGADAALAIIDSCVKTHLTADEYPAAQVTVKNCTFNGTAADAPAIRIRNSGNVTITGNTVANSSHNGILLESNGSVNSTVSKTVIIKDNQVTEWNAGNVAESGRGVRLALGTLAEGSTVTVEGNTFRKESLGHDEPDFVKITGAGSAAVDISGNDWNNMLLSEVSGNSAIYSCDSASAPVIDSVITTKKEPVAQIGANKYETLAEAIAAVPTTGAETTITMIANSAEPAVITVASGKNVVLDLNGKTVSYTTDEKNVYFLTNKGTLTVRDTSANAEGMILLTAQADTGYSKETVTIYNCGGTLTLASGAIKNATAGGLAYAVNNSSNAWGSDVVSTFNMEGGTVSAPSGDAALRVYQNCSASSTVLSKNYVNITGGTILDTGIFVDTNLHTANGSTEGFADSIDTQINISGGTVNGLIDLKIRHKNNTSLTITGGDFTNAKMWVRKYASEYKGDEPTDPMVYISGGKFAFVAGKAFGLSYDCGATSWTSYEKPYAVSGGVFNVEVPATACAEGYIPVANTDAATKDAYPYTVAGAVAKIGDTYYQTFAEAIAAAEEYKTENGDYPVIAVLDDTAEQSNPDWKIADGYLVKKTYVAQIVETGVKYETLAEAITAATAEQTVQMIADVSLTKATEIKNKSLTLDLNGYKISSNAAKGTLVLYCTSGGSGDIEITDSKTGGTVENTSTGSAVTTYYKALSTYYFSGNITLSGGSYVAVNTAVDIRQKTSPTAVPTCLKVTSDEVSINSESGTALTTSQSDNISVEIEGGEFVGNSAINVANATIKGGVFTNNSDYSTLWGSSVVEGGKFTTISGNYCLFQNNPSSGSLTISGGTFENKDSGSTSTALYVTGTVALTITDGTFKGLHCGAYISTTGAMAISGGMFIAEGDGENDKAYKGVQADSSGFFSGGYFSTVVTDTHCASGYLCTTKPVKDELYQVVPAKTVTYTLAGGDPEGAALPSPASFAYPSGDMAEIALTPATCTVGGYTFAGWKVKDSDPEVILSAIPAGANTDYELVATWTGARVLTIAAEEGKDTQIKVTDEWLEANGLADEEDPAVIKAALETNVNGVPRWESYVLGQSVGAAVSSGAEQGETTLMPVTSTIDVPAVDTGFDVQYRLDKIDASGNVEAEGTAQATPDLALELSGVASSAYYKLTAVVTAKDKSGASVTVQANNTIGVLKVESGAKTTAIAVPWEALGGGDISVSNIVRTATLTPGDELKAYDKTTDKYKVWTLSADKTWEPNLTATSDSTTLADGADLYTVKRGSAVWLTRQNTTQPIYLVGGVAATEKASVALEPKKGDNDPSWNLVGSAGTEPVKVSEIAATTDKIVVPTAYIPKEYEYVDGKGWGYWDYVTETKKNGRKTVNKVWKAAEDIPAGTGFWYLNGGDSKDINL